MNNIISNYTYSLLFCLALPLYGQDIREITVTGRGYPQEAAYVNAREQALKQCGLRLLSTFSEIRSGSNTSSSVSRQFYLAGIASGLIMREDTLETPHILPAEVVGEQRMFEVQLRLLVKQLANEDPYFHLALELHPERMVYHNGEQVDLQVQATKDCYITIFSLGADNRLYLIYPYVTQTNNFLKAHAVFPISGLTMGLFTGASEASESVIAIATKGNFPFIDFSNKDQWQRIATREGQFLAFRIAGAAPKLAEWLGTLGEDQWTIARLPYSIIK
jgi:hypothetical protein